MASYSTFTLRIEDTTPDAVKPTSVLVQAWPVAKIGGPFLKILKVPTDGTTISGHVKHQATPQQIATGIVDIALPDPRDATNLNPSGNGWLVKVKTNYFETTATFGPTELDAYESGGVLLYERVVPLDPVAFNATATYADASALAALEALIADLTARITDLETVSATPFVEDPVGSGLYTSIALTEDPDGSGLYNPLGLTEDPAAPSLYLIGA